MQIVSGILCKPSIEDEEPVEAANGGDQTRDRARRQPCGALASNERLEYSTVEGVNGPPLVHREGGQPAQIARVTVESVIGQATLDPEMFEISLDHGRLC